MVWSSSLSTQQIDDPLPGGEPSEGPTVVVIKAVGDFDAFEAHSRIEVHWTQGPVSARVVAAPNIQGWMGLDVDGSVLRITYQGPSHPCDAVRVEISSPSLVSVGLEHEATADVGQASLGKLRIRAIDAAKVRVDASAKDLTVACNDSAEVDARFVGSAHVAAQGASRVRARGHGDVTAWSSGSASIMHDGGLAKNAVLTADGASTIRACLEGSKNTYSGEHGGTVKCMLAKGAAAWNADSAEAGIAPSKVDYGSMRLDEDLEGKLRALMGDPRELALAAAKAEREASEAKRADFKARMEKAKAAREAKVSKVSKSTKPE